MKDLLNKIDFQRFSQIIYKNAKSEKVQPAISDISVVEARSAIALYERNFPGSIFKYELIQVVESGGKDWIVLADQLKPEGVKIIRNIVDTDGSNLGRLLPTDNITVASAQHATGRQ